MRNGSVAGTFLDIRDKVESDGEHGLLSMAFSPRYAQNHLYYVDYTDLQGNTHVDELSSTDASYTRELLLVQQPYPNHKGGQLEFDRHGFLYVGMGDGGTNPALGDTSVGDPENRAQNPASRLGKLLRIDPSKPGASWQTVGMGLRNPWRFSFDRTTGNLWIGDVGAARYEEIDFRTLGKLGALANYGWSRFEGNALYNPKIALARGAALVAPTWVYSHSDGGCGVIGGYVYRGARVPSFRGRYVFGDLCTGIVSSFRVGPKGRASIATRLTGLVSGSVVIRRRLRAASSTPSASTARCINCTESSRSRTCSARAVIPPSREHSNPEGGPRGKLVSPVKRAERRVRRRRRSDRAAHRGAPAPGPRAAAPARG